LTAGVKLAIADGEIALSNRHQNTGEEAETSCAASLIAGAAGEIGFNGVYLAAALRSLPGADTVEFGWTDAGGPCLLTIHAAAGTPHEGHGRVVMPMRI
jgi:DNA polymerase III sliding clamp (beta) subunit (PCNA family)